MQHASDCAMHNEPAMPAGPCNCGHLTDDEVARASFWIEEIMRHMKPNGNSIDIDAHAVAQILIGIERNGK